MLLFAASAAVPAARRVRPGGSSPAGRTRSTTSGYFIWLQSRVEDSQIWAKIHSSLQDDEVCQKLAARKKTVAQFVNSNLSLIQVHTTIRVVH